MTAENIQGKILLLVIIIFLAVSVSGMGNFGMTLDANGQMSNCPFMGVTAVCKMNPLEHIVAWQNMFTALPFKDTSMLAALLLLLAVLPAFLWRDFWNTKWIPASGCIRRFRSNTFITRNELQEAFSDGILHPKIF